MRRGVVLFILVNVLILGFLIRSVFTLLTLLLEDASTDAIHRSEIPELDSSMLDSRPQIIPKIIHQTYINDSIPEHWLGPQQSCINLHPDYEYKLWTDVKSREFIAEEYPWFLETFDGYKYPIQRADSIRYFVLAHYGGIYIDLDDGCHRRLDPLLSYPAWVRRTKPTGISNDAMGSVPQHPFFLRVMASLQAYDRHWFLPYITVMYSTGPLFLSVIWKEYMRDSFGMDRVRVLMPDEYNGFPWSFFTHHVGNSWHRGDAQLIFWMSSHWLLLTVMGFILAGCIGFCMWLVYGRLLLLGQYRHRYVRVGNSSSSSTKMRRRPFVIMPSFLRRISASSNSSDEELGHKEEIYSE
ncbi:Mannosyl phosphorylinositol ceramide synthase SUR1 [Talaromyces atroroseus]|uniref:Mannosyl phosphorylinositol ceramide synthase SUR1 n=1 Tax=Talaromyces atroroseus TaxID=1441469 RepID=A0A225ATM2_TALAT|nr:Mannosyl phosphorylinositol ceramide synthase SUR1 [Talaromyces atroroseus]OKL56817.1 Mannosyl phosphorylinositol ceramide synthase SUR1 [Talaromyces atroroseus]